MFLRKVLTCLLIMLLTRTSFFYKKKRPTTLVIKVIENITTRTKKIINTEPLPKSIKNHYQGP